MSQAKKYEQLKKLMQAFSEPYRGTLYHYTSADAISGIIDKGEIWMSNTAFVNDSTELRALETPRNLLQDSEFTNDAVREAWLDRNPNEAPVHYMASFSKKRTRLNNGEHTGISVLDLMHEN